MKWYNFTIGIILVVLNVSIKIFDTQHITETVLQYQQ